METKLPVSKIGLIRTTIAICSGTGIFSQIVEFPFSRTIRHFLSLALLASCAYMTMRGPPLMKTTFKYCKALHQYFGGVRFESGGLFPIKNENEAKKIIIGRTRIDYIPNKQTVYSMEDSSATNGIIWMPNSLYFWFKSGTEYQYFPLLSGFKQMQSSKGVTSKLEVVLNSAKNDRFDASIYKTKESLNFSEAKFLIFFILFAIYFAGILLNILFSIPLYAMIILIIFNIFGNRILDKIKFLKFFSVILYASFPAIIIGTIYGGLSLPFLDFKTVCFMIFSIYTFIVINSLQNKLNPSNEKDDTYDDDIF